MSSSENQRVILAARPKGVPGPEFFSLDTVVTPQPGDGEFLIHNQFLSVEPAMRGWVNEAPNYSPPVPVGDVMRAFAVGKIVKSNNSEFKEGEIVSGLFGWQRYAVSNGSSVVTRMADIDKPPSYALGILGLNGITAYCGLIYQGKPKPDETVVVSTAAGSVGSCVGQIAKIKGCRTVGITGGPAKVQQCLDEFGYDVSIDYKNTNDLSMSVSEACPDGVDIYFDNTCGPISDIVMENLNAHARVIICGTASVPDWVPIPLGPRVHRQLLVNRAQMSGLLIFDYKEYYAEAIQKISQWIDQGRIHVREHILNGMEHAPGAIQMLYRGENHGKLLIKVD